MVEARDEQLVRAAVHGDVRAFEALVRRHQERAYRIALRMLGRPEAAEEAAQDAFVRAWISLGRFRGDSLFSTWLHRIVVNASLDAIATRRGDAPLSEEQVDVREDPARMAELHARVEAVKAAILRLTPDQRAALVLRELEGLSYEEIAAVLEISLPAVKGRIHRARLELLERLDEWR